MAVGLAYKSSSNFSQTQSASGTFVMLSAAKASELESESSTCFPCKKSPQVPGGGGGYFRNFWVGMCRRDPGTLNLYPS